MTKQAENQSAKVPLAQQAEEIPSRWRWVEPCAWTVRMLATLEKGVEGGKWFRLFDKVFSERNLLAAFQKVARNDGAAGVDHVTVKAFERGCPENLWELSDRIRDGTFVPQPVRRHHVPKPGSKETRPLGIPTVRDRTVQAASVVVSDGHARRACRSSRTRCEWTRAARQDGR
jgi:RNA-directed DNA polymerase